MIPVITYPIPADNWKLFEPFVRRFCDTYRKFPPQIPHFIAASICGKNYDAEQIWRHFEGMPVIHRIYEGAGMDIGSAQEAARYISQECFLINLTTRCYFHRDAWLEYLMEAVTFWGYHRMYGISCSREGGKLHVCTRGYCMTVKAFQDYPHKIVSRDQGVFFELGDGSITDWHRETFKVEPLIVQFGDRFAADVFELGHCHLPEGFRLGDQKNMLLWDKHSDAFADADAKERHRLYNLMLGLEA
jgi:hypothetical protein